MNYIQLLKREFPLIGFGMLFTFFSSFGQTFLISLYLPDFLNYFGMTNGQFGTLYALATIGSAICLLYVGKLIDRIDLLNYSLLICAGMVLASLMVAFSTNMIMLLLGILGIRLSGQGLMSHTSMTVMGRYFIENRGKAVSVASMGHAVGEFSLPIIITAMIAGWGWRMSLIGSGAFVMLLLIPLVILILRKKHDVRIPPEKQNIDDQEDKSLDEQWDFKRMLKDKRFWFVVPSVFAMGFLVTAFFFFQVPLAEHKGWTREWIAACIMAFAVMSILSAFLSGPLIDRFSARVLFPYHLVPMVAGFLVLIMWDHPVTGIFYLGLLGVSMGFGNTIKSAAYAELFGTRTLGTVRSLFTVVMVFSTALGPVAFGWLLDFQISFQMITLVSILATLAIIAFSFPVQKMGRKDRLQT